MYPSAIPLNSNDRYTRNAGVLRNTLRPSETSFSNVCTKYFSLEIVQRYITTINDETSNIKREQYTCIEILDSVISNIEILSYIYYRKYNILFNSIVLDISINNFRILSRKISKIRYCLFRYKILQILIFALRCPIEGVE